MLPCCSHSAQSWSSPAAPEYESLCASKPRQRPDRGAGSTKTPRLVLRDLLQWSTATPRSPSECLRWDRSFTRHLSDFPNDRFCPMTSGKPITLPRHEKPTAHGSRTCLEPTQRTRWGEGLPAGILPPVYSGLGQQGCLLWQHGFCCLQQSGTSAAFTLALQSTLMNTAVVTTQNSLRIHRPPFRGTSA